MAKHKDKIKGGLADKKKPSDFSSSSLKEGQKIEMEHTKSRSVAKEIAMDHLVEDPKYYKKLKVMEKTMLEITPDGKQEIVEGKEPLKKDPTKKLHRRWAKLKKGLNNLKSIMDLKEASKVEDEQAQPEASQEDQQQMEQAQPEAGQEDQQQMEQAQPEAGQEAEQQAQPEAGQEAEQQAQPEAGQEAEQQAQPEAGQEAEQQAQPEAGQEAEQSPQEEEQKIIQSLRDHGYSEPEIAYIVHGHHSAEQDDVKNAKAAATAAMSDIDVDVARKVGDLEFNHKSRQMELEHEHNKRMKELEYNNASVETPDLGHKKKLAELEIEEKQLEIQRRKQEIELELEFKRKELELKLKHAEETHKKKLASQSAKGND